MAPKQGAPNNMATFVHSKDAVNDKRTGNVPLEDLKFKSTNTKPPANTRQLRAQHPGHAQHHARGSETQRRRQSDPQQHFTNADNSSIGDTSETPSTRQIQAAQRTVAPNGFASDVNHAGRSPVEDESSQGSSDDLDGVGAEDWQSDDLTESAKYIMQGVDVDLENQRAGRSLPYVKGDSYPSTTSGPSSFQEVEVRKPLPLQQNHAPAPPAVPKRRHGQPQPQDAPLPQRQNRAQPQFPPGQQQQHHHHQSQTTNLQLSRPETPEQFAQQPEAASGFSYAIAHKHKASTKAPINHQRQGETSANLLRQPLTTDAAQRAPLPEAERTNRQAAREVPAQAERKPMQGEKRSHGPSKATPQTAVQLQQASQPVRQVPPPQQQAASATVDILDLKGRDKSETPTEEELQLDHDIPQLYGMDYSVLKNESFDNDPRQPQTAFLGVATDDTIETQVGKMATFAPEDQHRFLISLPIDEWEQAGDWFLGKFGETLAKLKTLRQEKRQAARAFEKEIESRHAAVTKKRKLTESALGDMRTSGNMVLTPKKRTSQ